MVISSSAIKRMDVVVIDDSARMRQLLASLLRDLGCYSVRPFENVDEACVAIENKRPSMVLCDWQMATADGGVFLDRIRCAPDDRIASTPVVVVTGHGSRDILLESMKKGATQFLVKPVVPGELLKKMAFALNDDREMVRRNGRLVYMPPKKKVRQKAARAKNRQRPALSRNTVALQASVSKAKTDADVWEL